MLVVQSWPPSPWTEVWACHITPVTWQLREDSPKLKYPNASLWGQLFWCCQWQTLFFLYVLWIAANKGKLGQRQTAWTVEGVASKGLRPLFCLVPLGFTYSPSRLWLFQIWPFPFRTLLLVAESASNLDAATAFGNRMWWTGDSFVSVVLCEHPVCAWDLKWRNWEARHFCLGNALSFFPCFHFFSFPSFFFFSFSLISCSQGCL